MYERHERYFTSLLDRETEETSVNANGRAKANAVLARRTTLA
jgi:hypothetical protein